MEGSLGQIDMFCPIMKRSGAKTSSCFFGTRPIHKSPFPGDLSAPDMRHWQCLFSISIFCLGQGQSTCEALQVGLCLVIVNPSSSISSITHYSFPDPKSESESESTALAFVSRLLFLPSPVCFCNWQSLEGEGRKREHNYGFQFIPGIPSHTLLCQAQRFPWNPTCC